MPAGGFNVGKDVTIDIATPTGVLRPTIRTGFTSKQETTSIRVKGADGVNRNAEVPEGWSGSLDFERADPTLDNYFAQSEADYYAGVSPVPITITETISEVNGATSQYRYVNVTLKYTDAGNKTSDASIKQKVDWMATRRLKIV